MKQLLLKQMAVVCVAILLSSCGKEVLRSDTKIVRRTGQDQEQQAGNQKKKQGNQGDIALRDLQSAYGIRSFDQVVETMGVLTGVAPSAANISTVYAEVKAQLPSSNDIKTFLASHQVGVSKLSVEFCDNLINDTTLRSQRVPGFNFAAGAQTAFQGGGKTQLIDGLTSSFWGEDLQGLPDQGEVDATLSGLVDELNAGENMASVATTTNTAKGVCAAVLSAAPVMIF